MQSVLTPEIQKNLADLRMKKQLRELTVDQEGAPLVVLPDNVFGFTYSPLNESTPLYARRTFQSFEVHKLNDTIVHLLGFVKEGEAAKIFDGGESLDFQLYPEPYEDSTRLVEIPLDRIVKAKPLSRSNGNYMPIHLAANR